MRGAALACALVAVSHAACTANGDDVLRPSAAERAAILDWLATTPVCAEQGDALFEDISAVSGALHRFSPPVQSSPYGHIWGGGLALVDLDDDGHLDLFATSAAGPNRLFQGRGDGTFIERTAVHSAAAPGHVTRGVAAADVDGDGRLDLLLLGDDGPRLLLQGDEPLRFVRASSTAWPAAPAAGASLADVDGDGDLDLWVAAPLLSWDLLSPDVMIPGQGRLWRNDGGGFTDVTLTALGEGAAVGASFIGALVDLDGDGRADLLDAAEFGHRWPSALYRNLGGLRLAAVEGKGKGPALLPESPMGLALFDGEGHPDLWLSNLHGTDGRREVYLGNTGGLGFQDRTAALQAAALDPDQRRAVSWSVLSGDLDNDGDEDAFLTYGSFPAEHAPAATRAMFPARFEAGQPDAVLLREADGFALAQGACAEDHGRGRGAAIGDIDGDGCLDLIVANAGGALRVLRNRCPHGGRWLQLQLVGRPPNTRAVGAVVDVSLGGRRWRRWITSGATGVHSAQPYRVHVGLGEVPEGSRVTVQIRWPAGAARATPTTTLHETAQLDRLWRIEAP